MTTKRQLKLSSFFRFVVIVAVVLAIAHWLNRDSLEPVHRVRGRLRKVVHALNSYQSLHGVFPTRVIGESFSLQELVDDALFSGDQLDESFRHMQYLNLPQVRRNTIILTTSYRDVNGSRTAFLTENLYFGTSSLQSSELLGLQVTVEGLLVSDPTLFDDWTATHPFAQHDWDPTTLTYHGDGVTIRYHKRNGRLVRCDISDGTIEHVDIDEYRRLRGFRREHTATIIDPREQQFAFLPFNTLGSSHTEDLAHELAHLLLPEGFTDLWIGDSDGHVGNDSRKEEQ